MHSNGTPSSRRDLPVQPRPDMNTKPTRRFVTVAIAALCALAATLSAQTGPAGRGLNGTNYFSPTYLYSDIDDGPPDYYHGLGLRYNQALGPRFDLIVTGSLLQSDRVAGARAKQRGFDAGVRWHTDLGQARPFVEATVGGVRFEYAGFKDSSFTYAVGAGAEFQVTPAFSVAPLIGWSDATDFGDNGDAFLVLRTNLWINHRWSIRVNVSVSEDGKGLGAGFAYGF